MNSAPSPPATDLASGVEPMEARLVEALPDGSGWQFEPKWDGFRCIASKSGGAVALTAKSGKPLERYFPEMVEALERLPADDFVLDGELVVPAGGSLSFDALQMRLHPAESRIRKLSRQTPARLIAFDLLSLNRKPLLDRPLCARREMLNGFVKSLPAGVPLTLSPATPDRDEALAWLERSGGAIDGIVAKRLADAYQPGERAMLKVKQIRSADCVVGGFRYAAKGGLVGSLLLGLYGDDGLLHHVGFTSGLSRAEKPELTRRLERLRGGEGFTGRAPGGPSRWATERSTQWERLRPELVVEVAFDQVTNDRFRHGTRLLRYRPDKAPRQCTFAQIAPAMAPGALEALLAGRGG